VVKWAKVHRQYIMAKLNVKVFLKIIIIITEITVVLKIALEIRVVEANINYIFGQYLRL
jgi:predicted transglutaminase-like protease